MAMAGVKSHENLPVKVLREILKDLKSIDDSPPEGIRMIVNEDNISTIHADIEGPVGTPYEGGAFRMKLVLGSDFPHTPPKGYFVTRIFHPNVAKNGEICVNTLKKDWKPCLGIRHVLVVVRCLLIEPYPESALNEEAGKLLLEDYAAYAKHARLLTSIHALPAKPRAIATPLSPPLASRASARDRSSSAKPAEEAREGPGTHGQAGGSSDGVVEGGKNDGGEKGGREGQSAAAATTTTGVVSAGVATAEAAAAAAVHGTQVEGEGQQGSSEAGVTGEGGNRMGSGSSAAAATGSAGPLATNRSIANAGDDVACGAGKSKGEAGSRAAGADKKKVDSRKKSLRRL